MSKAFDRAMDEVGRVWDASDHFDTKVLQFVGIVSAGFLAAGAIIGHRLPSITSVPRIALLLAALGVVALLVFIGMAIAAAIGQAFAGPIDPRELMKYPRYLANDKQFEEDALPAVAAAFDQNLQSQEWKWRLFRWSLWVLGFCVLCFASAATIYAFSPTCEGATSMAKNPASASSVTKPDKAPANSSHEPAKPESKPETKPVLGPYKVTKGRTIPNEPTTGHFSRDTTRREGR